MTRPDAAIRRRFFGATLRRDAWWAHPLAVFLALSAFITSDGTWRVAQSDIDRVQEFRKCIECFLCQDVCQVLREDQKHEEFIGPRFLVYTAALEMHPLDTEDRLPELKKSFGVGYCNITKCCTKTCPEDITITDNAIIPLKERVVDAFYDPFIGLMKWLRPRPRKN